MRLEDELKASGCEIDAEFFRLVVEDEFSSLYGDRTDEELACDPREAIRFCGMVRHACGDPNPEDSLILRTLFNTRKRSNQDRKPMKGERPVVRTLIELMACGSPLKPQEFKELIVNMFHAKCRAWTDETLLVNPVEAIEFCDAVRKAARTPHAADSLILRTLTNLRKAGHLEPETAGVN